MNDDNKYDDQPRAPRTTQHPYPEYAPADHIKNQPIPSFNKGGCEVKKDIDPKEADRKMINAFATINSELHCLDIDRKKRVLKALAILNEVIL